MLRKIALYTLLLALSWTTVRAQATATTSYNAPYRAFERSEVGLVITFPNGGTTAFEGVYRFANGRFDIGFRGGLLDGAADAIFLLGAEGRQRVITHSTDFPLDGAIVVGIGAWLTSGNSILWVPVGLSLGRRIDVENSQVSIVPYVQPTATFGFGSGNSEVFFSLGLGADFRLTRRFDARISAGIGDIEGISIGAIWVH